VSERLARHVPYLFMYPPSDINSDRQGIVVSVSMDSGGASALAAMIPSRVRLADTNGLQCVGAMPSGCLDFANWWWWGKRVVLVNPITGMRWRLDVERLHRSWLLPPPL
jgi:hypothetical protein